MYEEEEVEEAHVSNRAVGRQRTVYNYAKRSAWDKTIKQGVDHVGKSIQDDISVDSYVDVELRNL